MKQSAAESPLRVFGAMLTYYRTRAGMTPEQLGARVFVSGSQIRKVEAEAVSWPSPWPRYSAPFSANCSALRK